jgi:ubiquinone/menaquinone biosynthesis C-methylase UbiE
VVTIGAISTAAWLAWTPPAGGVAALWSGPALAALAACMALTVVNLLLRWFRWHYLVRRFTRHITTRDSLAVYLATLPAILTPFFLGELVRVLILRRQSHGRVAHLTWVWVIERVMDAAVLSWFLLLATHFVLGLAALPALVGVGALLFHQLLTDRSRGPVGTGAITLQTLAVTVAAWALPIVALVVTTSVCARPIRVATGVRAFTAGTLSGGVSGLPLGVAITGWTEIRELESAEVPPSGAVLGVLVHRIGTSWFAVAFGVAAFRLSRRRLAALMRGHGGGHFDQLAHEYEAQIPEHVRERLLAKKAGLICAQLRAMNIRAGATGLDVGCGQGSYVTALASAGYRVYGTDSSAGQLRRANAGQAPADVTWAQADAQELPYKDATFDFVYSVNAFHHLPTPAAQVRALAEVVRVLRTGGVFVLHEINTQNPVFRLYMSYLFPLHRQIDEGTEHWILPTRLPAVAGASWAVERQYFTFLPDFVPQTVQRWLRGAERALERSFLRRYSAHYQACLIRDPDGAGPA